MIFRAGNSFFFINFQKVLNYSPKGSTYNKCRVKIRAAPTPCLQRHDLGRVGGVAEVLSFLQGRRRSESITVASNNGEDLEERLDPTQGFLAVGNQSSSSLTPPLPSSEKKAI
jgi:hypothetical protein